MAVNVIIRILFAMGREGSSRSRFLAFPATVIVFLLFPFWGILYPRGRTLMGLLPFAESPAQG